MGDDIFEEDIFGSDYDNFWDKMLSPEDIVDEGDLC